MPSYLPKPPAPAIRRVVPWMRGLVALWAFCERSGGLVDLTGRGNAGTAVGSPARTSGAYGPAGDFDGSDDRYTITDVTLNFAGASYTFFCRFRAGAAGTFRVLLNKGASGAQRIYFLIDNSDVLWRWDGFSSGFTIVAGTWYDLVYTLEATSDTAGTETFYIDGVKVATRTGTVPGTVAGTYTLGSVQGGGLYFNGAMDLAGFYDRALSAQEVAARAIDPAAMLRSRQPLPWLGGGVLPTVEVAIAATMGVMTAAVVANLGYPAVIAGTMGVMTAAGAALSRTILTAFRSVLSSSDGEPFDAPSDPDPKRSTWRYR